MVSHIGSHQNTLRPSAEAATPAARSPAQRSNYNVDSDARGAANGRVTLSSLGQQLSRSARESDTVNAGLSRKALAAKAATLLGQITETQFSANRAIYDAQVPESDSPERLAQAKQATEFVHGNGRNPFAGLSREELALITYDDSGSFTTNERRAAWEEAYDREYAWRQNVVAKAMAEYNGSGKLTDFFGEVLEHFHSLPAIEQAQYPDNYAEKLQKWIDLDYNYLTNRAEGKGKSDEALTLEQSLDLLQP